MGCPHCGALLAATAKFCSECGTPVGSGQGPVRPLTERRITSVLFGDLVGFTTLSESRDSEDVRELLSQYFETCRQVVERYGGLIEKFIGDAVMAVWGVPLAREDDAERAVRAGLDLVQAVAAFGASVGAPGLALRAGVVTGEVAVTVGAQHQGMVAGDAVNTAARIQGAAEPGTVWVDTQTRDLAGASIDFADAGAHVLKGKAEPMALHMATSVRGGRGGERSADRVQAPLVGRTGELGIVKEMFHVAVEEDRPRLVLLTGEAGIGKTRLAWELRSYLDGLTAPVLWHAGRSPSYGDGVAFAALTAAVRARIGSDPDDPDDATRRLLAEALARYVADPDERGWLGGALETLLGLTDGSSVARDELFRAWITWFERLHESEGHPVVWVVDDAQLADDGLLDFVERLVMVAQAPVLVVLLARPELLTRRPWLASLRRASPITLTALAPDECAALLRVLVEGAAEEVLDELVARVEGNPLYAVETVRALHDQGLAVSGPTRTPGAVRLADGVDRERLRALTAPASLQILIASRLDLLGPTERSVLAAASVLHPSVTAAALHALMERADGIADALDELVARDLLTPVQAAWSGVQRYAFVQTVARQVAYGTQSRRDRLARHLAAAEHFEPLAETDRDLSAVIAQHLRDALALTSAHETAAAAALHDRLFAWLERTARRAEAVGAPMEAVRAYLEALELTDDPVETVRLRLAAAGAAAAAGDHARALELAAPLAHGSDPALPADAAFAAAIASIASRRRGDYTQAWTHLEAYLPDGAMDALPVLAASRLTREIGACYAETGRLELAWQWQERSVNLAEDTADPREIVRSTNNFAITAGNRGHARIAIALFGMCVDVARDHHLVAEYALPLDNLIAYLMNRDLEQALTAGEESLRVSEAAGDSTACWHTAANRLMLLTLAGRWPERVDVFDRPLLRERPPEPDQDAIRTLFDAVIDEATEQPVDTAALDRVGDYADVLPESTGSAFYLANRAMAARVRGDVPAMAEAALAAVTTSARYCGIDDDFPHLWGLAAGWLLDAARYADVRTLLRPVLDTPATRWSPLLAAQVAGVRGALEANDPGSQADPTHVERDLRTAADAFAAFGAVPAAARAHLVLSEWLRRLGRGDEADALLAEVSLRFTDLGARGWLRETAPVPLRLVE